MIFVINNLKYDTDKMELISDECEYWYKGELLGTKSWRYCRKVLTEY